MKTLALPQKICLTVIENASVFLTVFLNQMIITVFPAYESVKWDNATSSTYNSTMAPNCTTEDASNSYVAILIGCKYCTELLMFPIVGMVLDRYHPPFIMFVGLLVEVFACVVYCSTGNFYVTILARVFDGLGYALVSTSGLTLVYLLYVKDRPRNRLITIDSILVYISSSTSPLLAGYVYESLAKTSITSARVSTFMLVGPLFFILALFILPFAFENIALFSNILYPSIDIRGEEDEKDVDESEILTNNHSLVLDRSEDKNLGDIEKSNEKVQIKSPLSLKVLLNDKHIILILIALIFISLTGNSLETTLPIFMIRKFCSDQWEQGIVWLFGMKSLLGFSLSTFLFHVKPSICWLLILLSMAGDGILTLSLSFCPSWWVIGLVLGTMCFLASMAEVILIPLIPMIIDRKYPNSGYGSSSGLTMITFTISGIIGTFPVGPLVDRFGFLTLCVILAVFNICLAPFIVCLRPFFVT